MTSTWTSPLTCDQVALRLGDLRERTLAEPIRGRVADHLDGCDDCAALYAALGELSLLLLETPPEPAAGFEERIAAVAAASAPVPAASAPLRWSSLLRSARDAWRLAPVPLAAILAVALAAAAVLNVPEERLPEPARRMLARGETARELLKERQERLFEDVGALRLIVGGVFSSRFERIQEQLEDYRRLVGAPERRKAPEPVRSFENFATPAPVAVGAGQPVLAGRPSRA